MKNPALWVERERMLRNYSRQRPSRKKNPIITMMAWLADYDHALDMHSRHQAPL